jgi:hypothetical protein
MEDIDNNKDNCYICYNNINYLTKLECGCKIYVHINCYNDYLNKINKCMICKKNTCIMHNNTIFKFFEYNCMILNVLFNNLQINTFINWSLRYENNYILNYLKINIFIIFSFIITIIIIIPLTIIFYLFFSLYNLFII